MGMGVWGGFPMHAHMHTHVHARTCMLNMLNMDASMLAAICNSIHVCVCMCMCVHACGGTPHAPRYPQTPPHQPAPSPEPQGAKTPKFNNS